MTEAPQLQKTRSDASNQHGSGSGVSVGQSRVPAILWMKLTVMEADDIKT